MRWRQHRQGRVCSCHLKHGWSRVLRACYFPGRGISARHKTTSRQKVVRWMVSSNARRKVRIGSKWQNYVTQNSWRRLFFLVSWVPNPKCFPRNMILKLSSGSAGSRHHLGCPQSYPLCNTWDMWVGIWEALAWTNQPERDEGNNLVRKAVINSPNRHISLLEDNLSSSLLPVNLRLTTSGSDQ